MWGYKPSKLPRADLPNDIQFALDHLVKQLHNGHPAVASYFKPDESLVAGRAPGRLDVMGGIADYSGATVLQLPLAESAVVFCQRITEPVVRVITATPDNSHQHRSVCLPLSDFFDPATDKPASLSRMKKRFYELPTEQQWVAYIAGVIPVLMQTTDFRLDTGLVMYVYSTVPEGKGVSSSAAIEVATMRVVTKIAHLKLDAHRQAVLCQQVENHVVGAPCGLMDQMTCSVGIRNSLLRLLCQPDIVQKPVQLPAGLAIWGIDSGERHAVSGSDYESVRVAAFMGYRMMLESAGVASAKIKAASIVDDRWHGYLANATVAEFTQTFEANLPKSISGCDFLKRYDCTTDSVAQVNPEVNYAVRVCTAHPIHEHFRVRLFAHMASRCAEEADTIIAAQLMGECMYQSHASYTLCGIGSFGTDDLVSRIRQNGLGGGLYGARITGGGSGGTVAVLAQVGAGDLIRSIASDYAADMGIGGQVFSGSSDAACDLTLLPLSV